MINEEKVKEMIHMAMFEQNEGSSTKQMETYFEMDYVGKEMLKSVVTATLAYLFVVGLSIVYLGEDTGISLQSMDLLTKLDEIGIGYAIFLLLYLVVTYVVYSYRYAKGRKQIRKFHQSLKRVNQIYKREERLR